MASLQSNKLWKEKPESDVRMCVLWPDDAPILTQRRDFLRDKSISVNTKVCGLHILVHGLSLPDGAAVEVIVDGLMQ